MSGDAKLFAIGIVWVASLLATMLVGPLACLFAAGATVAIAYAPGEGK